MSRGEPPECENCPQGAPLSVKHILTECPGHNGKRLRFFGRTDISMEQALKKGDTSPGGSLYRFIESTDLLGQL